MNRITLLLLTVIANCSFLSAKPVSPEKARAVAVNFYLQNAGQDAGSVSLFYTGMAAANTPAYYAFNTGNGFVIVSADDALKPIIGYSTERQFAVPDHSTTIGGWLDKRIEEVNYTRNSHIASTPEIDALWSAYLSKSNTPSNYKTASTSTVAPLVQTTWNQSPYYNDLCPGGSVTGCVATAMAQIMKFWDYPATGTGSSNYYAPGYSNLSCNYGATSYSWSLMPNSISSSNMAVAVINYHAGVSVEMNYSPSGSGAWVIAADDPVCAENSFKNYFRYDPSIIQGLYASNYTNSAWLNLLKNDLNLGRPIQYVGWDPAPGGGGHTWVCDGYDANDFFHMNWGWGGSNNGFFDLSSLNAGGYNFSSGQEALVGIVPMATTALDAGISLVSSPTGISCNTGVSPVVKLRNFGASNLTSCTINFKVDNTIVQTQAWTGSLTTGQSVNVALPGITVSAGSHTYSCFTSNPNGASDGNTANDQTSSVFNIISGSTTSSLIEGFENPVFSASSWIMSHTWTGADWKLTNTSAATGVSSCMLDNASNSAGNNSFMQLSQAYDLTAFTSPVMSFKMAYQKNNASNNSDRLQVFTSTNCGLSWMPRWARVGSALATTTVISSAPYIPSSSQFVTYTVNLSALAGSNNVLFKFGFFGDPAGVGNNIYLDDINISSAMVTGIAAIDNAERILLYPNPSSGQVNLEFTGIEKQALSYTVTDALGRIAESGSEQIFEAGQNKIVIGSKTILEKGIYFVNLKAENGTITKKFIIQ